MGLAAVLFLGLTVSTPAQVQRVEEDRFGSYPYGSMSMLLEKTLLQIDVVLVEMQFSRETARTFAEMVDGRSYSEVLADSVARIALEAPELRVRVTYQRAVSLDRYLQAVRENLEKARAARYISPQQYDTISDSLRSWYGPLSDRGFREGDELIYDLTGDTLDVHLRSPTGEDLFGLRQVGRRSRLGVLGGYLAPGTDFREPLVRSLLRDGSG
jgi:hypothetical protein